MPYDRLEGASKYYEFFDSKQVLEDGSFEWLDHLTRDSIKTNVDLKLPVHILKAYLGLRFTIRGESRSSTANRLALFPKDTFDECVAGMRQPEKSADLMGQANVMDD